MKILTASIVSLTAIVFGVPTARAESAIFWISGPVRPLQTVLLTGYFPQPGAVKLKVHPFASGDGDWRIATAKYGIDVPPLSATENNIAFILPAGSGGVYGFQVAEPGESPLLGRVNLPEIWWTMAESPVSAEAIKIDVETDTAVPGGKLRLFGRCLSDGPRVPEVELVSPSGQVFPLQVTADSPFALTTLVPASAPTGKYALRVRASPGGTGSESFGRGIEIHAPRVVPLETVNVTDFGAIGNGAFDNSGAFGAAMRKAVELGGGEVEIPAGAFLFSTQLRIPVGVYLVGEAMDTTILSFQDTATPPAAWVQGSRNFGLRNLSIYCGNHRSIVSSDLAGSTGASGHVRISRVRIVGDTMRKAAPEVLATRMAERMVPNSGMGVETLRLNGPDLVVEDSYIYGSGRSLYLLQASGAIVRRNKIFNGANGWYNFDVSENVINEDNSFQGASLLSAGGSYSAFAEPQRSQNIYTANNTYSNFMGNDREAFTSDGRKCAYSGQAAKADNTHYNLSGNPNWGSHDWHGAAVYISSGHGVGQWRTVRSWGASTVEVSSPFDVSPDATSLITIVPAQIHYILYRNHFEDVGVSIQFYSTAIEHITAQNDSTRGGGYYVTAHAYQNGAQPILNLQFLQNEIRPGLNYHYGPDSRYVTGPSFIGVETANGFINGLILRNNVLAGQAEIRIQNRGTSLVRGILLEGNHTTNPSQDVKVDPAIASGVILR